MCITHSPTLTAKYIVAWMFSKNKLWYALQLTEPSGVSCLTCYHLIWYNVGISGGSTDVTNLSQAKMFTENILTSNDQIQCNSIHNLGSGYLQVKFYMFFVSTWSNFNLHLYFMFRTYTFSCSGVLVVWRIWYCMVRSKKYLSRSFHHFAFTCRSQDIQEICNINSAFIIIIIIIFIIVNY